MPSRDYIKPDPGERVEVTEVEPDHRTVLHMEPAEDILLLGEMLQDVKTSLDLLRKLAISGVAYRGHLRVIRGNAVRTAERAQRLLGEV